MALKRPMNVASSPGETARLNFTVGSAGGSLVVSLWCGVTLGGVPRGGLAVDNRGAASPRDEVEACDRERSCCIDGMGTTVGLDPASPPPKVPSLMTRLIIEFCFSRKLKHATLCSTSARFLSARLTTI